MLSLTRREFLQSGALFAAATAFVPSVQGADPASTWNLGFSLYGMKTLPLEEALRTCAQIGYRNVELALMPGYPTDPDRFDREARRAARGLIEEKGLGISALMVNLSLSVDDVKHRTHLETLQFAAESAHDLAATPPPIETVLGGKPAEWEKIKEQMVERLQDWAAALQKMGATLALKAHVGSAVNSPDRLLWLLDQVKSPALVVAYDYSHFELQGIEMETSIQQLLPLTRFIHVKDASGDAAKFRFLLPGEGRTDYKAYFSLLQKHGYRGPIVVEVSGQIFNQPGYDPVAAARKSYAALMGAVPR